MSSSKVKQPRLPLIRNAGPHVALLVLKFYNKPTSLEQLTFMSPIKLSSKNRRMFADKLVDLGYATRSGTNENPLYAITQEGSDFAYVIARPSKR